MGRPQRRRSQDECAFPARQISWLPPMDFWSQKPANGGGSFYAVLDCARVYIRADPKIEVLPAENPQRMQRAAIPIPNSILAMAMNLPPVAPTHNSQIWLRGIRQHRKQLQHIPIRVSEIERCSGHPCNHHGFVGWRSVKVERNDVRCSKACRGAQQVRKVRAKRHVEA
jgi:hypothetical protein